MEIRQWPNQYLVRPIDMNRFNCDMYQHSQDVLNLTPLILWGLQHSGTSGNTVAFTVGAARAAEITTTNYAYLPEPVYGTGYPAYIQITASNNSVTLNTATTPCYIVATYTISPTTSDENLYTITGRLSQIATGAYDPTIHVKLAHGAYSGSWTIDQTPGTNRDLDCAGFASVQWNLDTNTVEFGPPLGYSGTELATKTGVNMTFKNNVTVQGNLLNAQGYNIFPSKTDVPTTGSAINSLTIASPFIKFTGSTATTVNGITAGLNGGQPLTIYNASSSTITFTNLNGSATGSQIQTPTGSSFVLASKYSAQFRYDNTASLWILILSS